MDEVLLCSTTPEPISSSVNVNEINGTVILHKSKECSLWEKETDDKNKENKNSFGTFVINTEMDGSLESHIVKVVQRDEQR